MKKITSLFASLCLCVSALTASAQTSPPTTPADFFGSVGGYLSSVNTNLTWENTPFSLWTGANYQAGVNTSAELGASYDLWKPALSATPQTSLAIAPELSLRNAGIAGTIVSGEAGCGLSLEHYDLKITGYLDGGYNVQFNTPQLEAGARLLKKMTTSTHAGIGLGYIHLFKGQSSPTVTAFLGWDF